ncbi:MAG TPA: DNA polymerase I [Candidatus Saccharimonadales bacterium]
MGQAAEPKKLVIIDGKSVFYRGYYAMPNLRTADGTPTGGVFGFATMALEVIKRLKPDYVAVAWDKPKTNIRKRLALYPEYKAGRKPAPADFYAQIPILHELLDAFGWPLYELDDYEADDIMGALAVQAKQKSIETILITSDMDMLQLVNTHVKVYALKTGLSNIELYSPKSFEAKYGIEVNQFLDLKSLKGDSSDNIPGVPGIGEKGAVELLKEYKTLDGVYENIELIKPTLKKKLEEGKDLAYLSKELARIWTDAPIKLDLNQVDGSNIKSEELRVILSRLQFKSLVNKLSEVLPGYVHQPELPSTSITVGTNILIDSDQKLEHVVFGGDITYIYTRSGGKHGVDPKYIILSSGGKQVYTLELAKLDKKQVLDVIGKAKKLVGHDIKNSLKLLLEIGAENLPQVSHDILIGSFLINSLDKVQLLTDQARVDLNYGGSSLEDLDDQELVTRAPEIMSIIQAIYKQQLDELKKLSKINKLAQDIEWPVIEVLARMEKVGIQLDVNYLAKFSEQINDSISDLEQQIYGYADQEFNISSPSQLAEILFGETNLNIPTQGIKKTKTGYSTAASELDKLIAVHPIISLISNYREVAKLKSTYVDSLPKQVDENSRLHTTFSLTVAQTGRLSSMDPNLQNIPIRTELGRNIRTAFVAGKGNVLISADYSQFELRLAAILAEDKELIGMFNRGADIHLMTAAQVYGREPEDVTKQMRRAAKVINFGIIYGMSPHGLTVATGMTYEQAQDFINKYKELRKPLFDYMDRLIVEARKTGYVETLFGRRRLLPDLHSNNFIVRQAAERAAINMPIQGTEADLMKMAMIKCEDILKNQHNDCNLLLQIHDSILVECPESVSANLAKLLKQAMEEVYSLPVSLDVDVTIGKNWGEL